MKRIALTALACILAIGCVAGGCFATRSSRLLVTISFTHFTNHFVGMDASDPAHMQPAAVFQIVNHTRTRLRCVLGIDGICTNGLSTSSDGVWYLAAQDVRTLSVVTPVTTNGWQFDAAYSVPRPRPQWHRSARTLLRWLGMNPKSLRGDTISLEFKKSWTNPS